MRLGILLFLLINVACQSTREKNALILKDRVQKLSSLSSFKPMKCEVKTELSAPQKVKYETAFADEKELLENWNVTYDWTARHSRCDARPNPLTPMTANQRAFVEEALCTLMQVFWVHSPFDDLKVMPTDVENSDDDRVFIRQKEDSDIGIYIDKKDMNIETKTARKGTFAARYAMVGKNWLPSELRHETPTFKFVVKDFDWPESEFRAPPKSFWIYVGEQASPDAHTRVEVGECKPY